MSDNRESLIDWSEVPEGCTHILKRDVCKDGSISNKTGYEKITQQDYHFWIGGSRGWVRPDWKMYGMERYCNPQHKEY